MKRSFTIFCLLVAVSASVPARAQQDAEIAAEAASLSSATGETSPALRALLQRSSQPGISRDYVLGALRGARQMQQQGLPTEAYLLKANEGLAKQVPSAQYDSALRESRGRTESAAHWVDAAALREGGSLPVQDRQRAIVAYQNARLNGIPAQRLDQLAQQPGGLETLGSKLQELNPRRHQVIAVQAPTRMELPPPALPSVKVLPPAEEKGWKQEWKQGREKEKGRASAEKKQPKRENPLPSEKKEWKKHGQAWEGQGGSHGEGSHGSGHGQGKGKK